mgnify:FL=1
MQCRKCETEIAEKALICYKCGTATTEAKHQPYVEPKRGGISPVVWAVIFIALVVLSAWFLLHSMSLGQP